MQRPWGIEGGFAVVYKFRTQSGAFRALRCFRVSINPDTQFRYERIGPYFHKHIRHITAGFKYHEQGILVKEQGQSTGTIYPVIEMDWIEGVTLVEKIDELCQSGDSVALKALADQWLGLIQAMQQVKIAHGDLAGVNVMVKPDGKLVLIDYDGVYIPEFATLSQVLVGQPDFQHPHMGSRKFNEHMDAFSALVIYTVLLALWDRPSLWNKHMQRSAANKLLDVNLLFTQYDYMEPEKSSLFQEMEQSSNQQISLFVRELKIACKQPIDQVRFPFHLIDPHYDKKMAFEQLEKALKSDDDEQIMQAWVPALEQYPPAQAHRAQVKLAQQRISALQRWRKAMQDGLIFPIISSYNPALDKFILAKERKALLLAQRFADALRRDDDAALVDLSHEMQRGKAMLTLTLSEAQRVDLALQRQKFSSARKSKDIKRIADAYKQVAQANMLTTQEQQVGELAYKFAQAYAGDGDADIEAAAEAIRNSQHRHTFSFTQAQQDRVKLARQRNRAAAAFRWEMAKGNAIQIADAYDSILDNSATLTRSELELLDLARKFADAYKKDQEDDILAAYQDIKRSIYSASFLFISQEQQRIDLAQQRIDAYQRFQNALQTRDPHAIASAYDAFFARHLNPVEAQQLALAQDFAASASDDQFMQSYRAIKNSPYDQYFHFTPGELARVQTIEECENLRREFDSALRAMDAGKIVTTYEALPDFIHDLMTDSERYLYEEARDMRAFLAVVQQLKKSNSIEIARPKYKGELARAQRYPDLFTPDEKQYIEKHKNLHLARLQGDYGEAIRLAMNNRGNEGLNSHRPQLILALQQVMRNVRVSGVSACIKEQRNGNTLLVSWQWPHNDLVQYMIIFWDASSASNLPRLPPMMPGSELRKMHNCEIATRSPHRGEGDEKVRIGGEKYIYTKVYAAMYDRWDNEAKDETWCFSPPIESRAILCDNVLATGW